MSNAVKRQLEQELSLPSYQVDVMRSLQLLDELLNNISDKEALALGEEFLPQLAGVYAEKAAFILERTLASELQQDDPPFNIEWLYPFMRRYQNLDISHLLGRAPNDYPEERQAVTVSELSMEEAEQYIREPVVAHSEDVAAWSAQIRAVVQSSATFPELLESTQLARAEVTLGILLGGFRVEQQGEFYQQKSVVIFP